MVDHFTTVTIGLAEDLFGLVLVTLYTKCYPTEIFTGCFYFYFLHPYPEYCQCLYLHIAEMMLDPLKLKPNFTCRMDDRV